MAEPGVETIIADAITGLRSREASKTDVAFAGNFIEHLPNEVIPSFLDETKRVPKPGGFLVLLQPNYRRCAAEYSDDFTHVSIHSDRSLPDHLRSNREIVHVDPGKMPLTIKSRAGRLAFLTPLYLPLLWRPLAKQMLAVASR